MFASTYMIVAMTVDRYHAVCNPMVSFLKGSFRRYLSIVWLISLAFSAPQLFIFSLQVVEKSQCDCWATFIEQWGSRIYISWITLSCSVCPAHRHSALLPVKNMHKSVFEYEEKGAAGRTRGCEGSVKRKDEDCENDISYHNHIHRVCM